MVGGEGEALWRWFARWCMVEEHCGAWEVVAMWEVHGGEVFGVHGGCIRKGTNPFVVYWVLCLRPKWWSYVVR